ncbi:hypothetical protein FRC01_012620 [Tulasnella sp. 417]|nr:hypothetical protein FRC01_012620 [Tulasnella sp. 417]
MPTGTPYHGHIPPYNNIRIDSFFTPRNAGPVEYKSPDLLLLTHTHSDHVHGLASKSFGLPLHCSADARTMLLRHESLQERRKYTEPGTHGGRPYGHLEANIVTSNGKARFKRKLLNVLPLNRPTALDIGLTDERVVITAIDANHCPGAVMYLIEGQHGAVLHTGDVRCEPAFIDSLKRNPFLRPYIAPPPHLRFSNNTPPSRKGKEKAQEPAPPKRLEAIYLDTACMMFRSELPSKESAVEGLVKLISRYPSHYKFFINSWTWGYEDALIGVATCFGTKIHVDRYKYDVYTSLSEPIWKEILTMDPTATRFHACERFDRCSEVDENEAEDVVYVNPNDMGLAGWQAYQQRVLDEMSRGNFPSALRFGLCRHSSLPELKALVGLFRPNRIVPNTVYPNMRGADWANIPHLFQDELPPGAGDRIWDEMQANGVGRHLCKEDYLSPGEQPRALLDYEELEVLRSMVEEIIGDHKFDEGLDLVRSVDVHVLLHETFGGKRLVEMGTTSLPQGALDLLRGNLQKSIRKQTEDGQEDTDDEKGLRSADEDEDDNEIAEANPTPSQRPTKGIFPSAVRASPPLRSAGRLPTPPSEPQSPIRARIARSAGASAGPSSTRPNSKFGVPNPPSPASGNLAGKTRRPSFMFTMVNPDSTTPFQSPTKVEEAAPGASKHGGKFVDPSSVVSRQTSRVFTRTGSVMTSTTSKPQQGSRDLQLSTVSRPLPRSDTLKSSGPCEANPGRSTLDAPQHATSVMVSFRSEADTTVGSVILAGETSVSREANARDDGERESKRRKVLDVLIPQARRSPVATRSPKHTSRSPASPTSKSRPAPKPALVSSKPLPRVLPVPPITNTQPSAPHERKSYRRAQKNLERELSAQLELANPTYFKPSEEYVLELGKRKAAEKGSKRAGEPVWEARVKKESPEV